MKDHIFNWKTFWFSIHLCSKLNEIIHLLESHITLTHINACNKELKKQSKHVFITDVFTNYLYKKKKEKFIVVHSGPEFQREFHRKTSIYKGETHCILWILETKKNDLFESTSPSNNKTFKSSSLYTYVCYVELQCPSAICLLFISKYVSNHLERQFLTKLLTFVIFHILTF